MLRVLLPGRDSSLGTFIMLTIPEIINLFFNFSNKISKKLSKPDKKFSADMIYGMLAAGSCLLTDVVDQLHENSKKVNSVERLTKHLNKGTPAKALSSYLPVIRIWVPATQLRNQRKGKIKTPLYYKGKNMKLSYHMLKFR